MIQRELSQTYDILLVEDNPGDARLAEEALKEEGTRHRLHWVRDGIEAMEFLRQEGEYQNSPTPSLILLDLNLPRMDGREVLAVIKHDELFRRIPVVVLTVSTSEEDIMDMYDLHANCYVAKPLDLESFISVLRAVDHFWLDIVKLPTR